jgi:hypothetical protein
MAKSTDLTTISITKETRTKLQSLMKYGETYDGILRQLMETHIIPVEHKITPPKNGG